MAICPFAVQQIIPESHTQGRIAPTTLIYHRAVSSAESLLGYWTTPGVELESHFYIGQHGVIYQFMDTEVRADANVGANAFAISVETWDGGNTPDDMPWNPEQLAAAKRLAAWVCETHGIKRAAAQTWNGGGIGGHNWFPIPWADGPRGCPGTARNAQIRNDIVPYVAAGGGWRDFEEVEIVDAAQEDRIAAKSANAVFGRQVPLKQFAGGAVVVSMQGAMEYLDYRAQSSNAAIAAVASKLDAQSAVLRQIADNDDRVTLDPAQLQALNTNIVGNLQEIEAAHQAALAEQAQQFDQRLDQLADELAGRDAESIRAGLKAFFMPSMTAVGPSTT